MAKVEISLSPFKAAIFDMDGTMILNMEHHRKAWQEFLQRHSITLTEEEFQKKISGKKNDQIFEMIFDGKLGPEQVQQYAEEKEAIYRELYAPDIEEVTGLIKFIDDLQGRNIRTAIATTAPAKNREFALQSLGLEDRFEVILGDEHVVNGKPNPEIFLSTANELSVDPSECIVFEDSPPGVKAGKNAGMVVVGLLTSHASDELSEADYLVNDFTDINLT